MSKLVKRSDAPHTEAMGSRTKRIFRNGPFTLKFTGSLNPTLRVTCDDPDVLDPTDALLAALQNSLPDFSQTQCTNFLWKVVLSAEKHDGLALGWYPPWEQGYREAGGTGLPFTFAHTVDQVFQRYLNGEEEEQEDEEDEEDEEEQEDEEEEEQEDEEEEMAEGWVNQKEAARQAMVAAYQAAGRDASSQKPSEKPSVVGASVGAVIASDSLSAAVMDRGVSVNIDQSTDLGDSMASEIVKETTGTAGVLNVLSSAAADSAKMIVVNELVLTAAQGAEELFGKSEHYPEIFKTAAGKQLLGVLMLLSILGLTMYMPGILPASMQSKRVQEMIRFGLQAAMVALIGPVVAHLNPLTKRVESLSEQFDR